MTKYHNANVLRFRTVGDACPYDCWDDGRFIGLIFTFSIRHCTSAQKTEALPFFRENFRLSLCIIKSKSAHDPAPLDKPNERELQKHPPPFASVYRCGCSPASAKRPQNLRSGADILQIYAEANPPLSLQSRTARRTSDQGSAREPFRFSCRRMQCWDCCS